MKAVGDHSPLPSSVSRSRSIWSGALTRDISRNCRAVATTGRSPAPPSGLRAWPKGHNRFQSGPASLGCAWPRPEGIEWIWYFPGV